MPKILFFFLMLLPFLTYSQTEGEVQFKEIVKFEIELPEDSPITKEQFEKMMPSEQVSKKVLYFNKEASLFTTPPKAENPNGNQNFSSEDGSIQIKMVRSDGESKTYHDITKNTMIDQRTFLGRKFLVTDEAPAYDWKITGESKTIAGYPCQQAITQDDDRTIEVWFTPAIPISTGPSGYMNLPGMVLEASSKSENGERRIVAENVIMKTLERDILKAPKKGKKVTEEEYDKIVDEKTKEMAEQNGGDGIRIRIDN